MGYCDFGREDMPIIPGALTPSEVLAAMDCGAHAVKVFPVSAMGGVEFVRALLEPIPDARLAVSVWPSEACRYLDAGVWGIWIGASLWRSDEVERRDVADVRAYAQQMLDACAASELRVCATDDRHDMPR